MIICRGLNQQGFFLIHKIYAQTCLIIKFLLLPHFNDFRISICISLWYQYIGTPVLIHTSLNCLQLVGLNVEFFQ